MQNPTTIIAADVVRTVFRDCQFREDYKMMGKIILVCKDWFEIGAFLLWKTMTIRSRTMGKRFLEIITSEDRGKIYKNALKTLVLRFGASKEWIADTFASLETATTLVDLDLRYYSSDTSFVYPAIGPSLCQRIETLTLNVADLGELSQFSNVKSLFCHYAGSIEANDSAPLVKIAPQLTHLELHNWEICDPNLVRILEAAQDLAHLRLDIASSDMSLGPRAEPYYVALKNVFEDSSRTPFPKLASIYFSGAYLNAQHIVPLFEWVRDRLTKVEFDSVKGDVIEKILAVLGGTNNNTLKDLTCPGGYGASWRMFIAGCRDYGVEHGRLFSAFTALESVELYCRALEPALTQLATSCHATLKKCTLTFGVDEFSTKRKASQVLRDFLAKCDHLEEFVFKDAIDVDEYVEGLVHPSLRKMRILYPVLENGGDVTRLNSEEIARIWSQCPKLSLLWVGNEKMERGG